ncbi:MAG: fatty acid desaturase CarF family protein [Rubripirellula sp.]
MGNQVRAASALPKHQGVGTGRKIYSVICIVLAHILLFYHTLNLAIQLEIGWIWLAFSLFAGLLTADFVTGVIHWLADSYGSTKLPFIGQRIIHSFRVHHINPADFLRRTFVDTNGDTCFLVSLVLVGMFLIPLSSIPMQALSSGLLAFLGTAMYSNQLHKWAHMRKPNRVIRMLQQLGLILSDEKHGQHHTYPHTGDYCVAPGWCNPILERLRFFRRMEAVIQKCTGIRARAEEDTMFDELRRPPGERGGDTEGKH